MQCASWSVWRLCHRIQLGPWPYFLLIYNWALGPLCFPLKMTCFFPNDHHAFFWSLHFPGLARKTNLMEHKKQPLWPKPRETNLLCIHSIPILDKEVDEEKPSEMGFLYVMQELSASACLLVQCELWQLVSYLNTLSELQTCHYTSTNRSPQVEQFVSWAVQTSFCIISLTSLLNLLLVRTCFCQVPNEKPIVTMSKPTANWNDSPCFAYLFVLTKTARSLKMINSVSNKSLKNLCCFQSFLLSPDLGGSSTGHIYSLSTARFLVSG